MTSARHYILSFYLFILFPGIRIRSPYLQCKHLCWLKHQMVLKFLTHTHTKKKIKLHSMDSSEKSKDITQILKFPKLHDIPRHISKIVLYATKPSGSWLLRLWRLQHWLHLLLNHENQNSDPSSCVQWLTLRTYSHNLKIVLSVQLPYQTEMYQFMYNC